MLQAGREVRAVVRAVVRAAVRAVQEAQGRVSCLQKQKWVVISCSSRASGYLFVTFHLLGPAGLGLPWVIFSSFLPFNAFSNLEQASTITIGFFVGLEICIELPAVAI